MITLEAENFMIELKKVIPIPLLENGLNPRSEVFNTEGSFFEQGKNYLISAASGKGKSTFIHAVYGLRNDYQGTIFFEKNDIKTHSIDDWATIRQKKMAIVFQDLRLFLHLTARENIELKKQLTASEKMDPSVYTAFDTENSAKKLGIYEYLDKTCATLSYGQRQRVAILRALSQPFDYLLLDEPFSHLDAENIKIATELIQTACTEQKAGLILVSLGEPYLFNYDLNYEL
jgi:ABC-type lipoprotein export system ATPase subunit